MAVHRRSRFLLLLSAVLLTLFSGCLLPTKGTPVYVDLRGGSFWSGKGLLLEVSQDQSLCRVAVRDRALMVRKLWVDCAWVHPQSTR
jgi:hypothetical protein